MIRERVEARGVSERRVRAALVEFARTFEQTIVVTSDSIRDESSDPELRLRAIRWKAFAVPACYGAALQEQPSIGLVNVWVLVLQIDWSLREGPAKTRFGEFQPRMQKACAELVIKIREMTPLLPGTDSEAIRGKIETWAAEHPIDASGMVRPSPVGQIADSIVGDAMSTIASVQSIEQNIAELTGRLSLFAETLPRMARWQAELALEEMFRRDDVRALKTDLAVMRGAAEELADYERVIDEQRDAVVAVLREMKTDVLASVDSQREATLLSLAAERELTLREVDRQRVATLEVVSAEREEVQAIADREVDEITAVIRESREELSRLVEVERKNVLDGVDRIALGTMDRGTDHARDLIDLVFLRVVQAGAALIGMALAAAWIYRRTARRTATNPA